MSGSDTTFPANFLWGAATSAYQIEGSPLADGAGVSNWHRFSHSPGRTANGETGDVACDHYRRYRDDVKLMREIGLRAYRFSIAWSRILPEGTGRVNQKGLDFYRSLVDALLENNIQPMVTLFHWDSPAALDDRGGWLNPDVASWFADYATVMFRSLGDRVKMWATLNEPWVVVDGGYLRGLLAPGHRNLFEAPIASANLMRAHAAAVQTYRSIGKNQIGLVVNIEPKYQASQSPEDLKATTRAEAYMNRQFLDPAFFGRFPEEMKEMFGEAWPEFSSLETLKQPIDFLGINYYTRAVTKNDPQQIVERAGRVKQPRATCTTTDWEVFPQGLTDTLLWVKERYGNLPMYVTENGAAFYDPPTALEGKVEDPLRISYLRQHFLAARAAMQRGVDLRGYFVWSLFDNYEWALGFSKRFGIIHVDYETQHRTLKNSARFYSRVIASNGQELGA